MNILQKAFVYFAQLVYYLIIVRMILSFIVRDLNNPIARFIYQVTEPILSPFRTLISKLGINTGMMDFSPLLAILALQIISDIVKRL